MRAGIVVQTVLTDMEFDEVVPKLPAIVIKAKAAKEHVVEIEHEIHVMKE